jgi:hypothetical protein
MSVGLEPLTARFEVQILGEELNDAHSGVVYFAYWCLMSPIQPMAT